jgi:hypothetical protein
MARYIVQTPMGRKRKVIYAKGYEEARSKLAEAIADRDRGLAYDSGGLTVEKYLARWLEDSVRGSVRPYTHQTYESVVRLHVCPTLGGTKLAALTPAQVQGALPPQARQGAHPEDGQVRPHHAAPGAQAGGEVRPRTPQRRGGGRPAEGDHSRDHVPLPR